VQAGSPWPTTRYGNSGGQWADRAHAKASRPEQVCAFARITGRGRSSADTGKGDARKNGAVNEAVQHIVAVDPALRPWVAAAPDCALQGRPQADYFNALVQAIVFQQLAGKAAAAIHRRVVGLFDGEPTPSAVLAAPDGALRGAGLSNGKLAAIRDLALKATDGTVPLERIEELGDEDIIQRLSAVRGIGRWTAEMFLIFQLGRPDVWPVEDLGVRRGYAVIHGLQEWPKPRELLALGDIYRPYRTCAALYCWRTADTVLPD
jgi:DNA-3-methyladenine glycosylase II